MTRVTYMPFLAYFLLAAVGMAGGCRSGGQTHDQRYHQLSQEYVNAQIQPAMAFEALNPVAQELAGEHSVEDYLRIGLLQNPEIEEARLMVESLANRVPQAASLPDPMLGTTTYTSPVQTAAGAQDFGLSMNQKLPWKGKLAMRAAIAEQDVIAARARLAEVELKVAEQIKIAYFQMYFIQQSISITEENREKLESIASVVEQMYRVKRDVTQQDVLQVQVSLSQIDNDLVMLEQQKSSARARLARLLHVSPETPMRAMDELPPEQTVQNIQNLYELAIQGRPELHAQLAVIEKDRKGAVLAELENYPDVTVGFNWIATSSSGISPVSNGNDAFMLTMGMNLPVYKKRIDAGVREAQTRALAGAKKYDRLKDEAMENVADTFARIVSQQESLQLFRNDIIPKQELSLEQSFDDYQVGKVDFLQLIENWRQLLRYDITEKRLESDLQMSLATLSRQIGSFGLPDDGTIAPPAVEQSGDDPIDAN